MELKCDWTLTFLHPRGGEELTIPATVPGNVELDLQRAGLITDYWPPDKLFALEEWSEVVWNYRCRFDALQYDAEREELHLFFDGIDTAAEIFLNGELLLECANMFIGHSADVSGRLKARDNMLEIKITPPALRSRKFKLPVYFRGFHPHQAYLRKARHSWGWDNAPTLPSCGIWRSVRLEVIPKQRLDEVYYYTESLSPEQASIGVYWSLRLQEPELRRFRLRLRVTFRSETVFLREYPIINTSDFLRNEVIIRQPHLWWPAGYGAPALYGMTLELLRDGEVIDRRTEHFGIRQIRLFRTEKTDDAGSGEFQFVCNGRKIYIRGTNWKPLDALHSRSAGKLRRALELCTELHCNMVRIWGGGVYEDHEFFDYCDEHGLLVWQDFMLACEYPPQDALFRRMMRDEAEWIIRRLRNHPSLALWSGDNEIDYSFCDSVFPPQMVPSDNRISREVLRRAALELDPWRDYLESSPFVPDEAVLLRNRTGNMEFMPALCPEQHLYPGGKEIRDAVRSSNYHFLSETGPILLCAMSESPTLLAREIDRLQRLWNTSPDELESRGWRHQSDLYLVNWKEDVKRRLKLFFGDSVTPSPDAPEELIAAVNLFVCDTFKFIIEYSRCRKWRKTGVIWWSLIDMWPMLFNFSVIDYEFRPKLPFFWIRQSQQEFCLICDEPDDGSAGAALTAVNDTGDDRKGVYRLAQFREESGQLEYFHSGEFHVEANGKAVLPQPPDAFARDALYILEWELDGIRKFNHFIGGAAPYDFARYRKWGNFLRELYSRERDIPLPGSR